MCVLVHGRALILLFVIISFFLIEFRAGVCKWTSEHKHQHHCACDCAEVNSRACISEYIGEEVASVCVPVGACECEEQMFPSYVP